MWIVAGQIKMEDRDTKKEMDQNEKRDHSVLTKEAFNLAEETERYEKDNDNGIFSFELRTFRIFNAYVKSTLLRTVIISTVFFQNG